jgi:DNA primase
LGVIPDAKIAEIRERADIVEVVSDYVSLKRAGVNHKGVCPFHADSDPSFNVNPDRQFFHCFGCGASGDVITFLRRVEGLEFTDAVERLAQRYGVELPREEASPALRSAKERNREDSRRRREVLELAAAFFESRLDEPEAEPARRMLEERGVDRETARRFRLGYAPDGWQGLLDHLGARRVGPREASLVGLALERKSQDGFYDRFRHRLVFTISDPAGSPIGFSARALGDREEEGAKYVNSPETAEFSKGKVLFGLHQARVALSKTREAVLVEGNFDVVSLARVGIDNVVAPLGTALTEDHVTLLRRRVDRVVVMFDGDAAGRAAAARAFPLLARAGLAAYTAPLPAGEDPDSLARSGGAGALGALIEARQGLLDEIITDSAAAGDGTAQDAARRIARLGPFVDAVLDPMERDVYRQRIADAFRIDPRTVFRYLRGGPASPSSAPVAGEAEGLPGRAEERELVGLLLDQPQLSGETEASGALSLMTTPALRRIADELVLRQRRKDSMISDMVADDGAVDRTRAWLARRAMERLFVDPERASLALEEVRERLARHHLNQRIREIEQQISLAHSSRDSQRAFELQRKKAEIQKEIHGVARQP